MKNFVRSPAFASLPKHGALVAVYNTAIAVVLAVLGFGGGFAVNFVYSQCIGLSVWLLTDVARRLLWPNRPAPTLLLISVLLGALPIAWLGGTWTASRLLGLRWRAEGSLSSLLITAGAGFLATIYFWEREKMAELEAKAAHEKSRAEIVERQIAEARLKLLQTQIEPHFLFNTLANLQVLIHSNPERARLMLDHLDGFLRAALTAARKEETTLADEFALLRNYLEILAIRMGPRLQFRLELPDSLAAAALPPMLLQPLVENAVKHGIDPKLEGGEITVSAERAGGILVLKVSDTGAGLGPASPGTGIEHVRQRLKAVYGGRASLEIADNGRAGVTATLRLPLEM
jgi:hypothetical protein